RATMAGSIDGPQSCSNTNARMYSGVDRKYEGTGLGLSLVKSMAELHDATVEIESASGVGTTVIVRFPASRVRA
ncbi:MAG: hypothetical protein HOJ90_05410, partial [Alphaproteobacteria bacterium]|nr:hypothetical protein [Alphaproteobacteria bacterium]